MSLYALQEPVEFVEHLLSHTGKICHLSVNICGFFHLNSRVFDLC